jgi:oxygen-independent coproporphyrinogen-3 oxidase
LSPTAIYIHTPFCPSKCGYCDFNSYAMTGEIIDRTVTAMEAEIRASPWRGVPAKTIFFGGGTPTFLPTDGLLRLLQAVVDVHPPVEGCEVTSEANPGTVDAKKFGAMRGAGFNRLSLGAQSFFEDDLVRLGRVHRVGEIERAVGLAREAGFDNVNLDLMFALPGQSLDAWGHNLRRAIQLDPEHLSLYCLTLEPNTPFYVQNLRGQLVQPDEDDQVAMFDSASEVATAAGYEHYEISNFAKPGRQSQHNLCYWRSESYAGYGPGAVGFMDGRRYTNLKHPTRFCDAVESGVELAFESEEVDYRAREVERIMLGIRLSEGISPDGIQMSSIQRLAGRGWLEVNGRLRLTAAGRHFCTEVALELID